MAARQTGKATPGRALRFPHQHSAFRIQHSYTHSASRFIPLAVETSAL